MERRIKNNDLGDAGSEQFTGCLDSFQIRRVVKRCEVNAIFNSFDHFFIDHHGSGKFLAPVYDPMAHGMNITKRANRNDIRIRRDNPSKQIVECGAVITQGSRLFIQFRLPAWLQA
jgi:hypothetical protein